jgi:hypothetical protein
MDYIGVRGVDGPDSTGVSTDTQAHAHALRLCVLPLDTPHPDIPQTTCCLDILARYRPLACSLISGTLGDVVETMVPVTGTEQADAGLAVVCTQHQHV